MQNTDYGMRHSTLCERDHPYAFEELMTIPQLCSSSGPGTRLAVSCRSVITVSYYLTLIATTDCVALQYFVSRTLKLFMFGEMHSNKQ